MSLYLDKIHDLSIVNLKMILENLLSLPNLCGTKTISIYKLKKVIIIR